MRLFSGVVAVQLRPDAFTINQMNEHFCTWNTDEDAARGQWTRITQGKHPGAPICYIGIYDITETARAYVRDFPAS